MKKLLRFLPLWLLCIVAFSSSMAEARTVRLFIIGNSFSGNAARFLPEMAKEGGHELIIGRAELGGCSLERHWNHAAAAEADANDPKGKPYNGKSLKMLLSEGTWDIITLQQYSLLSGDVNTYRPFAKQLYDYVKQLQPQAEIVFHQTWAYRSDAKAFGKIDGEKRAQNQQEMWENSRAAYRTIAGELGSRVIPVGDAFWTASSDPQWGYKKDAQFDFATPVAPALPDQTNSLHVGYRWSKEALAFDANHANNAGCYLGGLMWYGFLFKESPEKLIFVPPAVPEDFAAYLRKVAAQTLSQPAAE